MLSDPDTRARYDRFGEAGVGSAAGGPNVGDMFGHIPLPAKLTVEALPAIDLRQEFGPEPDIDEIYDHLIRTMQETLDALASERRLPVIG